MTKDELLWNKGSKLLVCDDEADKQKIKPESNSNSEGDNNNIVLDHYIDLSMSDGNAL